MDDMASPPPPALTDDLLSDIFLRLPEPADLVRASAACVPFRRIVADRAFLRRFRSLHPAPLLGFLDNNGFHPALPPHASAPAARAVSLAADFSFSFLPASASARAAWVVRDIRDGRVLLDRAPEDGGRGPQVFMEIAVCDPLHRRCVLLPPVPDGLAAVAAEHPLRVDFDRWCEPFLAPRGHGAADDEEASFGVICLVQCRAKLVAVAFSSTTGQWRAVASLALRDLIAGVGVSSMSPAFSGRQYARGCFYWVMDWRDNKLLVLDAGRMEFCIADLPPDCHRRQIAIVEAGDGMVGMFALRDQVVDGAVSLYYYTVRREDADGYSQWQMEKIIPLDPEFRHYIRGAMERYILLLRFPEHLSLAGVHVSSSAETEDLECFSMDVRTFQLEKVCKLKNHIMRAYIYTNFPPSLSPQTSVEVWPAQHPCPQVKALESLDHDLLEKIFLRVAADLGDLFRLSATCSSFHQLISDESFRHGYRSLYPPLLLGVFAHDGHEFQPAEAPHPNARVARSLAFDYLPPEWIRCDVRDGRVLLIRPLVEVQEDEVLGSDKDLDWDWEEDEEEDQVLSSEEDQVLGSEEDLDWDWDWDSDSDEEEDEDWDSVFVFPDLAVCDPLHQILRQLPPIPEYVIASVPVNDPRTRFLEALLVPSSGHHQEGTSFKVLVRANCRNMVTAFIFSTDSGLWSVCVSTTWADLGLITQQSLTLGWPRHERGCFYWKVSWRNKLLKLDINRAEFSTVDVPPGSNEREFVTVVEEQAAQEGQEDRLGMFSLTRDAKSMLYFTRSVQNGGGGGGGGHEWLHKDIIQLPCYCNIVGAFEGYIFLLGVQTYRRRVSAAFFSFEIKTRKIERLCSTKALVCPNLRPYFGYPKFMSPRRVLLEWVFEMAMDTRNPKPVY
ncbi:hypothetical protein U9M48_015547 [Paspalum notatum var. saurae]|uniref:F-box domain-containing protein n=1 Tax=Paspalum notatum var. saurae TaxID=547442 RepID=A0AAQ3WM62_PASNO